MRKLINAARLQELSGVWMILILLTLGSFELGRRPSDCAAEFPTIVTIAAVKARLIVRQYMELKSASFAWRLIFDGLIAGALLMLTIMHALA